MRVAVIGVGFVGRAHIEALRRLGISIAGILGSSPDRTQEACKSIGIVRGYASLEELCGDAAVEAVHICTPNYLHFAEAEAALKAKKHVVCEKPLATSTQETSSLVELARREGRAGAVAYNLRYYPLCQEARALLQRGAIGEPRLVHGSYLQDWLLYPSDWNWRIEPQFGGPMRTVADIGTHWLDLVTWITGKKLTELCADVATVLPTRQRPRGRVETFQVRKDAAFDEVRITTDDYASILLHFEDNLRGVVTVSQMSAGRKNRVWFEVDGSEGSLAWNGEQPNVLWLGHRNEANRELIKDPALLSPEARGFAAYPGGHAEGYPDTFVRFFDEFYSFVAAGNLNAPRKFPTFEKGHDALVWCEAIAASARARRWVAVTQR